jgi:hypothetical protein
MSSGIVFGEIQKNIEIPISVKTGRPKSDLRIKTDSLSVGDSFDISVSSETELNLMEKKLQSLRVVFRQSTEKKLIYRNVDSNTLRVWRVE